MCEINYEQEKGEREAEEVTEKQAPWEDNQKYAFNLLLLL